jgi:hypothetical protein
MSQAASAATLASFAASAKKDELVLFLAHCGEKHAGSVDAARAAAIAYVASQPHRAAAALAGLRRRADPPAGSVFTDITRAARGGGPTLATLTPMTGGCLSFWQPL